MIFDCFTFFDELDLLELRLRTLDEVADRFVLCEAPFTFRGAPKPLYFSEARERFARWNDRITLLVYDGAIHADPWANEWGQRNFLARGLEGADPDDLIMLSDCDEIPAPKNVAVPPSTKLVLGHRHTYALGYVNRLSPEPWIGTRSIMYRDLPRFRALRDLRMLPASDIDIVDGGWHFSHLGGTEVVERKMKSYAHSEYDLPYYTDRQRLQTEFGSDLNVSYVPVDDSFPAVLQEPGPWERFIWRGPVITDADESRARQHVHGCFAYVPADAARVVAVTRESALWEEIGTQRFGVRFAGVVESLSPGLARGSWVVVDGFERTDARTLETLRSGDAGVVAFLRNARSFVRFEDVINGKELAPGRAIGIRELLAWAGASGRQVGAVDRLQTTNVYAPWTQMPEQLGNVTLGTWLSFTAIGRDVLADFIAQAFVVRLPPQQTS
jgi:beta-1,4-mannosyl-glycoprotein beta-1,4-N-acetylglucosaminyltransferase